MHSMFLMNLLNVFNGDYVKTTYLLNSFKKNLKKRKEIKQ